jgi:hypothetical protein
LLLLFCLKLLDLLDQVQLSIFGLKLLAHGESNRGLVERLVSSNRHSDFITHSKEQLAANGLCKGHLSDDLVEALAKELFTNWADAAVTCLALHELLVELFTKARHINSGSLFGVGVSDQVFAWQINC